MDRLKGGGGRGDNGEAVDELGNVFLQWRARKATATLSRKLRSSGSFGAARGGGERMQMEQASASGRRWLSSGARTRDVEASVEHACHAAISSYAGRPRRALTVF